MRAGSSHSNSTGGPLSFPVRNWTVCKFGSFPYGSTFSTTPDNSTSRFPIRAINASPSLCSPSLSSGAVQANGAAPVAPSAKEFA